MEIEFEIDDGYALGTRPQSAELWDNELEEFAEGLKDGSMTELDIISAIEEAAHVSMMEIISAEVTNMDEILEYVKSKM